MIKLASLVSLLALAAAATAQSTTCTSTFAGAGCGGTLNIGFTPQGGGGNQVIDIQATGLLPNVHGIMIWGTEPANIALPGGCTLLVEFTWGHTILTDSQGEFNWSRTWPAGAMPNAYHIQIGSFTFNENNEFVIVGTDAQIANCHF